MPNAQDVGYRGLRQQQQLQIAKKYVVFARGFPHGPPPSVSLTRTCRDKIYIQEQGDPSPVDLRIFGNIFKLSDREEEGDTSDIYTLDCSKLPEGYFCFMITLDPYTYVLVMHHGIPIFYFGKPTSSTNPVFFPVGYEEFFTRNGYIDLTTMRHELQQRMSIPQQPKQSAFSSFPPGLNYQQGRRIHLQLRRQLEQAGRPYPKEIIRRMRDIERFLVAHQPKRGGR
jgi:hypothetical protein